MCSRSSASKPRCDVIGCVHWTIGSLRLENNKAESDHDRKRTSAFGEPGRLKVHSRVGSWWPARSRPCTSWLRIIGSAPNPATIPPLHHHVWGLSHDAAAVFLSARAPRTALALGHAPSGLAEPRSRVLATLSRA